jgi:hypothetical protein
VPPSVPPSAPTAPPELDELLLDPEELAPPDDVLDAEEPELLDPEELTSAPPSEESPAPAPAEPQAAAPRKAQIAPHRKWPRMITSLGEWVAERDPSSQERCPENRRDSPKIRLRPIRPHAQSVNGTDGDCEVDRYSERNAERPDGRGRSALASRSQHQSIASFIVDM